LTGKEKGTDEELLNQVYEWLWALPPVFPSNFYLNMKKSIAVVAPRRKEHYLLRVSSDYIHYFVRLFGLDDLEKQRMEVKM